MPADREADVQATDAAEKYANEAIEWLRQHQSQTHGSFLLSVNASNVLRLAADLRTLRQAVERIADPTNHHFKPDYVTPEEIARAALAAVQSPHTETSEEASDASA